MRTLTPSCLLALSLTFVAALHGQSPKEPVYQGKPLSEWLKKLRDGSYEESSKITAMLLTEIAEGDAAAVPPLIEFFKGSTGNVYELSLADKIFKRLGPVAIPGLMQLLHDPNDHARTIAAIGLRPLGKRDKSVINLLRKELEDAKQPSYWSAIGLLGTFGSEAKEALPQIRAALKDDRPLVRFVAAESLSRIEPNAKAEVLPVVRQIFEKRDAEPRLMAAMFLWRVDHSADAKDFIVESLLTSTDGDRSLPLAYVGGLGRDAKDALPQLIKIAREDKYPGNASSALRTIGQLGAEAEPAVPDLIQLLEDTEYRDHLNVIEALAAMGRTAKPAVASLVNFGRMRSVYGQWIAIALQKIVGELGGEPMPSVKALIEVINTSKTHERELAILDLGRLGAAAKEAVPFLIKLTTIDHLELLNDGQTELSKTLAIQSLGMIGPEAKEAVSALLGLPKLEFAFHYKSIAAAVQRIDPEAAKRLPPRPKIE